MAMVNGFTFHVEDQGDGSRYVDGHFSDGNEFDLGCHECWGPTTADVAEINTALAELDHLWMDEKLGTDGRRNDDAVNLCICLHVLGCADVGQWYTHAYDAHATLGNDPYDEFEDHILRVQDYLCKWGPDDDMGRALDYMIR